MQRRATQSARGFAVAILACIVALGASCTKQKGDAPMAKKETYPTVPESALRGIVRTNDDSPTPTKAQLDRKRRSTEQVKQLGLPTLDSLPVVEDESAITPRTKDEVAARCIATMLSAVKGESNDQKLVDKLVAEYGATRYFSPEESDFIRNTSAEKQDLVDFAWRYEAVHVFLWALGYLPNLNPPNQIADVASEVAIVHKKGAKAFFDEAKLRPMPEILDQADLYYRLHWSATDLRLNDKRSDAANEEIIQERHRALNWLIRYMNQSWDDVTTDT